MTGWNLPPGCTNQMIEDQFEDGPCEVCGQYVEACICPECPKCGTLGDPDCYNPAAATYHGMVRNPEQIEGLRKLEEYQQQQAAAYAAEAAYWRNMTQDIEAEQP